MSATATSPTPAAAASPPAAKRRPRVLLLIGGLLLVGALGAGGYVVGSGSSGTPAEAAPTEAPPAEGAIVEIGTLTTNLAGPSPRYARVGIALVLEAAADPAAVEARTALVKDAAISQIGTFDAASLQTADGTGRLRAGLADRITALFPDGEVLRVVLTELLVQ